MSSASSRRSFYPLPPSLYPQPLVDPCAALETTYGQQKKKKNQHAGRENRRTTLLAVLAATDSFLVCRVLSGHHHCAHTVRDDDFFRSRTLNPHSTGRQHQVAAFTNTAAPATLANAAQGIYPRHGTGQFVLPYYRRDSKGYRRGYEQPVPVDDHYSATKTVTGLINGGFQFSHPSSRPTYSASRAGSAAGAGATFSTSYRNSGLYDSTSNHTSRVARTIGDGLQAARSQQLAATQRPASQTAASDIGYYTQEVLDQPPAGAEAYENGYESNLSTSGGLDSNSASTSRAIFGDPLLANPLENAYRKPRTVYKRSFGKCQ